MPALLEAGEALSDSDGAMQDKGTHKRGARAAADGRGPYKKPALGDEDPKARKEEKGRRVKDVKKEKGTAALLPMITMMAKLALKNAQVMGDLSNALVDTFLVPSSHTVIKKMGEQGQAYQREVKKAGRGHQMGPPHPWMWGGLIAALHAKGEAVGSRNAATLKEHNEALEGMTMVEKLEIIRICRLDKTYQDGFKRVSITIYGNEPLRLAILGAFEQSGATRKQGKAPASFMERDIQMWLEALEA